MTDVADAKSEPATEASTGEADAASAAPDEPKKKSALSGSFAPYGFVVDGTPTAASEELHEARWQESERRRDQAAMDKKVSSVPIAQGGGKLFTNRLTSNPDVPEAYTLLTYVNRKGAPIDLGQCLAMVKMEDWSNPNDLSVFIYCPRCIQRRHFDQCLITVKQSNKFWHATPPNPGEMIEFDDGYGMQFYVSAGTIVESETFNCGYCSWRGVFDKGTIREI